MTRWHGPNGIEVEVIVLNVAPLYKVSQTVNGRRYHVAYAATIERLAEHVDLADLVEIYDFPAIDQASAAG
ncbi:hypothetical protein ACIBQ6_22295 [Nonomuraea sp. NPDC049655]|uniref:hypothetical protein n=1 Tax=Nonomuraea sp. NPDC049655 TaxID=3364355 RepID=UPI0037AB2634